MRRIVVILIVAVLAVAGLVAYKRNGGSASDGSGPATAGGGGRMGRGGPRAPMPVEFATVSRGPLSSQILVVGNLIGAATVEVVPKVSGRVQTVTVKLGDTVRRGQLIAKVEDLELQQQVRQAEASYEVAQATIRQREADLKLARTNLERSQSLVERQLLAQQAHDDTEARYQAAVAQLDLARAQFEQSKARLDELKITLSNTNITSPVDGFVGKRFLDPGAFVGTNAPVVSVVDIRTVRLVANLVERDVRQVSAGTPAVVEVDAYPGETFSGTVSRVAPVFDPATRTAEMEIEVPNPGVRLKPGMYARVQLTVDARTDALTVPRNAIVDVSGQSGVFVAAPAPAGAGAGRQGPAGDQGRGDRPQAAAAPGGGRGGPSPLVAKFIPVETGVRSGDRVEILRGVDEGARVITLGAGALRDGDQVLLATGERGGGGEGRGSGRGGDQTGPEGTR